MYADDHSRQVTTRLTVGHPPNTVAVASAELLYRQTKARLSDAQQGTMEAGIEFLAARAALRDWLGEIWPGQVGEEAAAEPARDPASRTPR